MNEMRKILNMLESMSTQDVDVIVNSWYGGYMGLPAKPGMANKFDELVKRAASEYGHDAVEVIKRNLSLDMFEVDEDAELFLEKVREIVSSRLGSDTSGAQDAGSSELDQIAEDAVNAALEVIQQGVAGKGGDVKFKEAIDKAIALLQSIK